MDREPGSIQDLLGEAIEPWMDVLLGGLSAEILPGAATPARLTTVRPGGNIPAAAWDAVVLRADGRPAEQVGLDLARAAGGLRHGGQAILLALGVAPAEAATLLTALAELGSGAEAWVLDDGSWLALARKTSPGGQDLVGVRRCVRTLTQNVERLEGLLSDVGHRNAALRPLGGGRSIKEWLGGLGDLDRDGYLAAIRRTLDPTAPPATRAGVEGLTAGRDHNSRPLAELVVRFRHFRWQSQQLLDGLREDDWLRVGVDLDGHPATIADLVRAWVRDEAAGLRTIEAMVG